MGLLLTVVTGAQSLAHDPPQPLDFNRDIRPVLADACFPCHGPDTSKNRGGLRLDLRESAIGPSRSGKSALVPLHPKESELLRRIESQDPDERMPPPSATRRLSEAERKRLARWITEGAPYSPHWAFVPPKRPKPPAVRNTAWVRNPIDRFVLARLEQEGRSPSPEAKPETLLRRLSLDLTGLPPTPDAVNAYLHDRHPSAYERRVDQWMASRDYAERRAQDWLDLARYADTRGFADDQPHAIWPYRDWVIEALNRNQPFDAFTVEQLAGDLLPAPTLAQRIATGFHRNAPQAKGATYPVEEYRLKGVIDRVNTTATVWLGLTLGCAECHDHKFDPLPQLDYYRLLAIFNNIEHSGTGFAQGGPHLEFEIMPGEKVSAPVMVELEKPRATYIHRRGNFLERGEQVQPGVPSLFGVSESDQPRNRLEFARWLVNGRNPLVARVVVNRFWQSLFGQGLVGTVADFGLQGDVPTHPELLDWLASEFVESGWDMKALHRLIVMSATYRQSSHRSRSTQPVLPAPLLAAMPRLRLPAEQIRDQALAIAGLLTPSTTGRPFFPPQPADYWEERDLPGKWAPSGTPDLHRKSLYIYWRRMALHPSLEILDAPARSVCTARRVVSNLPTQALVTMNDPIFVEAASAFAQRIIRSASTPNIRLQNAFRVALGRFPDEAEQDKFLRFLQATSADEHQAWRHIATVLLNLDETLTRP